ncbi:MAG: hypothetical protein Q8M08_10415 [Bacteroidales bacterium]|nr:hypothetical protein [Bacteroidales bacterium]
MNQVEIDGKTYFMPSDWNELTKKQVLFVSRMFQGQLTMVDFKLRVLLKFLSIKPKAIKRIHPEDAYFLCESLDFLFKEVSLTRNLLPLIKTGWREYIGPSDAMMNCTFGEFTMANSLLDSYSKTREQKYLDEMVAVLYRPKKWFWFIRKAFTDNQDPRKKFVNRSLKKRCSRIAVLDYDIKYSVFLFFSGVLNSLPMLYPYVYEQKGDAGSEDNGWASLIISLADGKTDDKSLETIMNSNLYNVFIGLNKKGKEYHEYMSKIESYDRH